MRRLVPSRRWPLGFLPALCALVLLPQGLLLAQDAEPQTAPAATENNRALFANFMHFSILGKFQLANTYAQKLLDNNPDPAEILQYADEHTNSLKTLILLINHIEIGDNAKRILELIHEGELLVRQDPQRIQLNIRKLGGDPQTEFNAISRLRDSGEYVVPWLISTLQDRDQANLHSRILRMVPKIGKAAVNPLVIALKMDDPDVKQFVARALGEIGYPQAIPYLKQVLEDPRISSELKTTAEIAVLRALTDQGSAWPESAAAAFLKLAEQYYADNSTVQADPRADFANVWYWREGRLQRTEVPREIFNEIMVMRCCEESLRLQPDNDQAIAFWLAANIRREAQLGLDVEAVSDGDAAALDPTKQEDFPRSTYFARSAGARYCHLVLGLAMRYQEPAVALGAIAALRLIAGATSLVGAEDYKQPLAAALTFPDLVVRIKAALALAHARPGRSFAGADQVVPLLGEALAQTGGRFVLVVDPDEANLNRVMGVLRDAGATAIGAAQLYAGLERARQELPTLTAIVLASDVSGPTLSGAMSTLRSNNETAMTPVLLLAKEGEMDQAKGLAQADPAVAVVVAYAEPQALVQAWQVLSRSAGQITLERDEALALALDAADALRQIAYTQSPVYDFKMAEGALINALSSKAEVLQVAAASVLALAPSSSAQQALAQVALNGNNTESLRVAVFGALAESAKVNGNLLPEQSIDRLIDLAINEPNLVLRTAGSKALGALNLPSNKIEQVIANFYEG